VANKNSDFTRPYSDLFELLPEVLQSSTNESVFNNALNRMFSKPEIERANGIVGEVNDSLRNRQIQEPTPHRQAFQLQPVLNARIGGENYTSTYVDLLNELERLGVDPCRQKIWGSAKTFNWIPPIDLDKFINFRDYFWVDPTDPSSPQQYITIENRCAKAKQLVVAYQETLDVYDNEYVIQSINSVDNVISIPGNLTVLFAAGFRFFVRGSTNASINNTFFNTLSSTYNITDDTTDIIVQQDITNADPGGGVVSLTELLSVFFLEKACACDGDIGWSQGPWDGNDFGFLGTLIGEPAGTFDAITLPTAPLAPNVGDLWYDISGGAQGPLRQYNGSSWEIVVANFDDLLSFIQSLSQYGELYWDSAEACNFETNQWIEQNKWIHKNAVVNTAAARQATQPIIEYSALVQLNKWNFKDYVWKYRDNQFVDFNDTTDQPQLIELKPLSYLIVDEFNVTLSPLDGDLTSTFVPGYEFRIENDPDDSANDTTYTVVSSSYTPAGTVVTIQEGFAFHPSTTPATTGEISPVFTSQGDTWRGYNIHWVLVDVVDTIPVTPKPETPNVAIDPTSPPVVVTFSGVQAQYRAGDTVDATDFGGDEIRYAVEYTITQPGGVPLGVTVPLDTAGTETVLMDEVALVGQNDIRVYVDDIRQYGQFVEIDGGSGFVSGIQFDYVVPLNSTIRIEVGPPAASDVGRGSLQIRTIEDEAQFAIDGPELLSLINYRRSEQVKTDVNQYPLFDVVNVDGTDAFQANQLFGFKESSDAVVNVLTGLRLEIGPNGNYVFEQYLLEEDNGKMFAYLLNGEPQTIWREGNFEEEYIPEYVDSSRNPVPVGDPNGFWEIPDQLYFNSEHENRQEVTFRELVAHFSSIINAQSAVPGVTVPGNVFYLLLNPNFGLGGRIKEHNFSYDTLLSAIFVDNVTPRGVIDFAHEQYLNSLNTLKEIYRDNLVSYLTNTSASFIDRLEDSIAEDVIRRYELNDYLALLYGDSNTYDPVTDSGVRNWPATLPYIRMAFARRPYIIQDEDTGVYQLVHHDGHRSTPTLAQRTKESLIQLTINTVDERSFTGETFGIQTADPVPTTFSDLGLVVTQRTGIYWYQVVGTSRVLYRFAVASISVSPPIGVQPGAFWYDTGTQTLRQLDSSEIWQPVTSVGDEIITAAWEVVDLDDLLSALLLDVETRLYDYAPELEELAFDVPALATSEISCPDISATITEADTFNAYLQDAFIDWLREQEIDDPYSSSQFYDPADPFTWNYNQSIMTSPPQTGAPPTGGWWTDLYNKLYNTPYPHLEPWRLQGYEEKPEWWDEEYLDTTGTRRWIYNHATTTGMWQNIRIGAVPVGRPLPDGVGVGTGSALDVPEQYAYVSVNIDDVTLDGYGPDDVFPPYWDFSANGGSASVRSAFQTFGEIVAQSADYTFGDGGPVEFEWSQTAQRLYDDLTVGFRMEPVRFFHSTFGEEFIEVGGLNISADLEQVYSHKDVRFHGDIYNTNELLQFQGLNQWYVNFNRASGFDTVTSNFRPLWTNWNPLLAYQFGSVIDTSTFTIDTPNFEMNARDYRILLKNSPGIDNLTFDALNVKVLSVPNRLVSQDTESLWRFQLDTFATEARTLSYYNVRNYPVRARTITNVFGIYEYNVTAIDQLGGVFTILGNQVEAFSENLDFMITESTGNNGVYTATNVVYDSANDVTLISTGASLPDPTVDGVLTVEYRSIPWETGDAVEISSTVGLPSPFQANTTYYVIRISDTEFQLASTARNAFERIPVDFSSAGIGKIEVGQIAYKFIALDGSSTDREWKHYVLDTDSVLTVQPPVAISGIQNLINVIDGYAELEKEEGFEFNYEFQEIDVDLQRPITWETETERFLDAIFRLRSFRQAQPETYPVAVDPLADEFVFSSTVPSWVTGQKVRVGVLNGMVPTPLLPNTPYYLIMGDDPARVQVALTRTDALLGNAVDLLTGGSGPLYLTEYVQGKFALPSYEINPARTNLWVRTLQGILSDISKTTAADLRGVQLITDQNGDQLTTEQLAVFRLDKLARINVQNKLPNPLLPTQQQDPTRDFRHIASANLFIDGTEHIILFNDNSVEGFLIYDQFVGLNTARFELLFFRQQEFTQRPVVGGYYLTPDEQLRPNIESSVLDLQNAYDTYRALEASKIITEGRRSLGYAGAGTQEYLTELNLNAKSQFAFWRGFIASKGSTLGLDAFANSETFAQAEVDEVWAFKVAEFGSSAEQEYISLNLTQRDALRADTRIDFLDPSQDRVADTEPTFEGVFLSDQDRWADQPDQAAKLSDNGDTFYLDADITDVHVFTAASAGGDPGDDGRWYVRFDEEVFFDDVRLILVDSSGAGTLVTPPTYEVFNSQHIVFSVDPATLLGPGEEFRMYAVNPNRDAQNPAKVIDTVDELVVTDVPFWDPRRGYHYTIAENVVTFESDTDPATYNAATIASKNDDSPWREQEVGRVWWNTAAREYVPYHDEAIFPDRELRYRRWGQLADFADIELYQWTESDVPPEEYDAIAAVEAVDISIDPRVRKSGTAKSDIQVRTRVAQTITVVNDTTDEITVSGTVSVGDKVTFTGSLPAPLRESTFYYVLTASGAGPTTITVSATEDGEPVDLTTTTAGGSMLPPFDDNWIEIPRNIQRQTPRISASAPYTTFSVVTGSGLDDINNGDTVDVYINGLFTESVVVVASQVTISTAANEADRVSIVKEPEEPEDAFDPETDPSPRLVQRRRGYNYSVRNIIDEFGNTTQRYYFWVRGKTARVGNNPSLAVAEQTLRQIPTPYLIPEGLEPAAGSLPLRYTRTVFKGLSNVINDNGRYVMRFTRDFTLRDELMTRSDPANPLTDQVALGGGRTERTGDPLHLKTLHAEWTLVRQGQPFKIPREYWDRITESVIGRKLDNPVVRVPSFVREAYDAEFGTQTRYGLNEGQAFVNGQLALATVIDDLQDPTNNFAPVDVNSFFQANETETEGGTIAFFDNIYNNFSVEAVNRIFFKVLLDALSTKDKYPGIFKTSWVTLEGSQLLQTEALVNG
jgi:hypothetical protein